MRSLGSAMDEPEDLLQLVLGMTTPSLFTDLFANAGAVPKERFADWFDEKTKTFGGQDVLATVRNLLGHCDSFDYQDLQSIPPKDLPDLQLFFEEMLGLNKRRIERSDQGLSFITPEQWRTEPGISGRYENLRFARELKGKDAAQRVLGVGHKLFDLALKQAVNYDAPLTTLAGLDHAVAVWRIYDRITSQEGAVMQIVMGVGADKQPLLQDWQVIDLVNTALQHKHKKPAPSQIVTPAIVDQLLRFVEASQARLVNELPNLHTPFARPDVRFLSLLIPAT